MHQKVLSADTSYESYGEYHIDKDTEKMNFTYFTELEENEKTYTPIMLGTERS